MGCATINLTIMPRDASMLTDLGTRGEMTATFERGSMSCDLGERGSISCTLGERAEMELSIVCIVGGVQLYLLCTRDGVPVLTLDGEYIILNNE